MAIKIEGVKDERLFLSVEYATEWFLRPATAVNVKNVRNVKLSRAHKFPDIPIGSEVLLIFSKPAFLISSRLGKFMDLGFKRGAMQDRFVVFRTNVREIH